MNISDEKLSGFLDAELSPVEMEQVRQALETDDELVMRMAELSQVDQWVVEHAEQIDQSKVPQRLVELAQQIDASTQTNAATGDNNVVTMAAWKNKKFGIKLPYSLAAGVALVVAVGTLTFNQQGIDATLATDVAAILDTSISGQLKQTADGTSVKAQLSFENQNGELCRQYQLANHEVSSTAIACKQENGWHVEAQLSGQGLQLNGDYQTASNQQDLDTVIDQLIKGAPLDRTQEQQAIANRWQVNK